jgi:maltose O-acetyltransferase
MRTERERMLAGDEYNSRDPELIAIAGRARALLKQFNASLATDGAGRHALLVQLLGHVDSSVWIEPPFFVDYGAQVRIGAHTFVNVNCVFLDSAPIDIGENVLIGPAVQLLTVSHPPNARERLRTVSSPGAADVSPHRTYARPIAIGNNAWIGAGAIVLPGVSIGANSTVGAGSVVTRDVPPDVLAVGNPCRVVRDLPPLDD